MRATSAAVAAKRTPPMLVGCTGAFWPPGAVLQIGAPLGKAVRGDDGRRAAPSRRPRGPPADSRRVHGGGAAREVSRGRERPGTPEARAEVLASPRRRHAARADGRGRVLAQ